MTTSTQSTVSPTPSSTDEIVERLRAANGAVLYSLADLMTVFASRADLNGGDFVEAAGEAFATIARLACLPSVESNSTRSWWREVADSRDIAHDGDDTNY
jgi:hypothetical protein